MKLSSFYPELITNNLESAKQVFSQLGFAKAHDICNVSATNNNGVVCKDEGGHLFQIVEADVPRPFVAIRMNVDNFDEALARLKSMGFIDQRPDGAITAHSRATMLLSPEGYMVHITEHIKE